MRCSAASLTLCFLWVLVTLTTCRCRQSAPQIIIRRCKHLLSIDVPNRFGPPRQLLEDLIIISPTIRIHHIVDISSSAAALYEPLSTLLPVVVEDRKGHLVIGRRLTNCKQTGHCCGIFNTHTRSSPMMWRCRMCCITEQTNSSFVEVGTRVTSGIEDGPSVQVRFEHFDYLAGRFTPVFEVFHCMLLSSRKCKFCV